MTDESDKFDEPDFESLEKESRRRSAAPVAALLLAVVAAAVTAVLLLKSCSDKEPVAVTEPPAVEAPAPPPPAPARVVEPRPAAPASGEAPAPAVPETEAVGPEPVPAAAVPPPPSLPMLDASNELVAKLLRDCLAAGFPELPPGSGSLIRLFVVVVDNAAEGASPRPHLGFLGFEGDFAVVERDGRLFADPVGYRRYDGIARTFSGLDAAACAAAYGSVKPLIDEAYRDLGYPDRPFDGTLKRALGRIVDVALPQEDVLLIKGEGAYHYEDPSLEALSGMERQVVRMGPANSRVVQESLRRLAAALALD